MAYRRKGGAATAKGGIYSEDYTPTYSDDSTSLAAAAIRASSAHRASSLSSAYGESALASAYRESSSNPQGFSPPSQPQDPYSYEYTSMKSLNETKSGFWGVLARKAKSAMFEDDNTAQLSETGGKTSPQFPDASTGVPFRQSYRPIENNRKTESPPFQKGLDALTSSLINIRGSIGNALEEGLTIVENRTADIISETRKLHIRRKGENSPSQNQASGMLSPRKAAGRSIPRQAVAATSTTRQAAGTATTRQPVSSSPLIQTDQETQLKASRDVAMAMAAKAKLLMRELKTIKADLAFAKERCTQLEEENKILRESRDKGDNPEDDDLIRLQLETLLAEKARLAHENSVYARENRFLREIVEYHQLTMQDVVYFDEGIEEVSEVCPIPVPPAAEVLPVPVPPSTEVCPISMPSEDQRLPSPSHST